MDLQGLLDNVDLRRFTRISAFAHLQVGKAKYWNRKNNVMLSKISDSFRYSCITTWAHITERVIRVAPNNYFNHLLNKLSDSCKKMLIAKVMPSISFFLTEPMVKKKQRPPLLFKMTEKLSKSLILQKLQCQYWKTEGAFLVYVLFF